MGALSWLIRKLVIERMWCPDFLELRQSKKAWDAADDDLSRAIVAAKSRGVSEEDMEGEVQVKMGLVDLTESAYRLDRDRKWLRKMGQLELFVPVKSIRNEMWERSVVFSSQLLLTEEAFNHVRAKVREEQKQRREPLVTVLTLVIGLMGAVTGLVAVLVVLLK